MDKQFQTFPLTLNQYFLQSNYQIYQNIEQPSELMKQNEREKPSIPYKLKFNE